VSCRRCGAETPGHLCPRCDAWWTFLDYLCQEDGADKIRSDPKLAELRRHFGIPTKRDPAEMGRLGGRPHKVRDGP
jgi:hypothetical protein